MTQRTARWLLLALLCHPLNVVAAAEIGDTLQPLALRDAADTPKQLAADIRRIYATADRRGDRLLNEALKDVESAALLDAQGAVVIADISAAPGFIRRIIRSNLRERGYSTWIDQTGETRTLLPYRSDQVSVIDLDGLRITAIRGVSEVEILRALLRPVDGEAPAPTP